MTSLMKRAALAFLVLLPAGASPAVAQSLVDVFSRVAPAVVVVYTESTEYQFTGQAVVSHSAAAFAVGSNLSASRYFAGATSPKGRRSGQ